MMYFDIVCSCDNNYASHCLAMIRSLVSKSRFKYHVHLLSNDISETYLNILRGVCEDFDGKLSRYHVDEDKLDNVVFRKNNPLTKAAYYRILLSSILPDSVSKVLYLDCDIIVRKDISDIFETDLKTSGVAAVRDLMTSPVNKEHCSQLNFGLNSKYFNSGVMLINLDYWRTNDIESKLIEFSRRKRFVYFHDQDALNFVFKDSWIELSPKWNYLNMSDLKLVNLNDEFSLRDCYKNPVVVHYASSTLKPWNRIYFIRYSHLYKKQLVKMNLNKVPISGSVNWSLSVLALKLRVKNLFYYVFGV